MPRLTEAQITELRTPVRVIRYTGPDAHDPNRPRCSDCRSLFNRPLAFAAAWRGDVMVRAWCHAHWSHAAPEADE